MFTELSKVLLSSVIYLSAKFNELQLHYIIVFESIFISQGRNHTTNLEMAKSSRGTGGPNTGVQQDFPLNRNCL